MSESSSFSYIFQATSGINMLESIEKTLTIFAILIGGIISWAKFVGGRADKVRLEPFISCEVTNEGDFSRLLVTMRLCNKGLFAAAVPKKGFQLEVLSPKSDVEELEIQNTKWETVASYNVFTNHNVIQTGESAQEQLRLSLAKNRCSALQLGLRVIHQGRKLWFIKLTKGTEWRAMIIVNCKTPKTQSS